MADAVWVEDGRAVYLPLPRNGPECSAHLEDATPGREDDRAYVGVRCLACSGIHLVSRVSGRLAADMGTCSRAPLLTTEL